MMLHECEKSGHRDIDGIWVDETVAAKLRNQLSNFWTLSTILSDESLVKKLFEDKKIQELVFELAKDCESNKSKILELIDQIGK